MNDGWEIIYVGMALAMVGGAIVICGTFLLGTVILAVQRWNLWYKSRRGDQGETETEPAQQLHPAPDADVDRPKRPSRPGG